MNEKRRSANGAPKKRTFRFQNREAQAERLRMGEHRMKKRIASVILTLCLVAGLMPAVSLTASAADATTSDKAIMWGTSGISGYDSTNGYDYIYYGTYQQSSNGDTDPIKWRVLSAANTYKESATGTPKTGLFLLSDIVLDQQEWNNNYIGDIYRNYGTSDIRTWLNGTGSGNFLYDAFSSGEQAGIATTYVETADVAADDDPTKIFKTTPTEDKIFLLSNEDVQNSGYGFDDDDSRKSGYSAYAEKEGVYVYNGGAAWWLRSPSSFIYEAYAYAAFVNYGGFLSYDGYNVDHAYVGVRPAFNLNLNSVLFTSAAVGGKSVAAEGSDGKLGGFAADAIFSNATYTQSDSDNGWKLTLLDSDRSGFAASVSNISGNTLKVSYSGAKTGNNEYISAMIKNGDEVKYYGRLELATAETSNEVEITLPDAFNAASGDTLYIFNEQYNGDYKTDYASALKKIEIVSVTTELTDLTSSNTAPIVSATGDYTTTLTVASNDVQGSTVYAICDDVQVYVGDSQTALTKGTDYTFTPAQNNKSGELIIYAASITGNVKIVAAAKKYAVEVTNSDTTNLFDFGAQTYGYSSVAARTMTVKNTGNQDLTVTMPTDTGDFEVAFSDTNFNGTLAANSSVVINFKPKDNLDANDSAYTKDLTIGVTGGTADFSQTINAKFVVNKADATDAMKAASGGTKYGASGTVDLSEQLAAGYELGTIAITDSDSVLSGTPAVENGVLSYAFVNGVGSVGKTATVTIPVTSSTNYNTYNIVVTLTVLDKYTQTVSFAESTVTKTYGDAVFTNAATTTGNGTITYSSSNADVAEVNSDTGAVTIKKASDTPVTITATAAETDDYKEATATYTLTVNKKPVEVSIEDISITVGSSAPAVALTFNGLVGGDTVNFIPEFKLYDHAGSPIKGEDGMMVTDFEDALAEAVKTVGTYKLNWTNKDALSDTDQYDFSVPADGENATLTVKNRPSSGGYTPPVQSITVPISGDENTINVDASVSGSKATVDEVDLSKLDSVIGEDVNTGVVTIDFSGLNKSIDTVEIPSDVVKQISAAVNDPANDAESLEIVLSDGTSIEFDAVALGEKAAQADGLDITISIESSKKASLTTAQKNAVGGNTAYDINVTSGGKHITDMGGKITVHAPYELKSGEKPRGVVVYYVDENGNKEACETSYDSVRKRVNWKTDHLSLYMIDYDEELAASCPKDETCPMYPYTDVDVNAWYHDGVHYAIENGLMKGTSLAEMLFSPNGTTTRAQIVTILWRMEGEPVCGQGKSGTFADVPEYTWYTEAVEWAASEEIVLGWNGDFSPDDPITREQFAAILWRYAKYKGYDVSVGENTNILSYEDALTVSEYAIPAMQWVCGTGIIEGIEKNSSMYLDPQGDAIRCQAATIMMRFDKYVTP